jgi:hypothetical protein
MIGIVWISKAEVRVSEFLVSPDGRRAASLYSLSPEPGKLQRLP